MPRTCCFRSWTWWKGLQYGSMLCLAADLKQEVWAKLRRDFWGAFLLGSERQFFSNHGSQGRETLRFKQPKTGFLSPSKHHKTVGSIWLSPHIFRNCCKLLQPSIPERSAMAFPAGSTRAKIWPRHRMNNGMGRMFQVHSPEKKGPWTRFTQINQISCKWQLMCFQLDNLKPPPFLCYSYHRNYVHKSSAVTAQLLFTPPSV